MLLAKILKIKTLKKQRNYIKRGIFSLASRGDAGDPSFRYTGYIYPEVIKYFETEGFDITVVKSDLVLATTKGKPIYIFTPKDNLELSEKEMEKAENFVETQVLNGQQDDTETTAEDLINSIFRHNNN